MRSASNSRGEDGNGSRGAGLNSVVALASGPSDGLSGLLGITSLGRAVTDTVGPVGLAAEAAEIASRATKFGVGNAGHVVGAELSAWSKALGNGGTSDDSDDGERLHVDGD